jgi:3-deoxy-D-manno-octulosonic-acid transferase
VALDERPGGRVYVLYNVGLGLFLIVGLPLFLYRGLRTGKYLPTFWERMGRIPARLSRGPEEASIWIHAVSVGEVLTSRGLALALKKTFPDHRITLSTTTLTGQAVARQNMGGWDELFCAPFDFPFSVRKALGALNPKLLILVETELWPNLIREARKRGTRIAVVNGRISGRSFPRYRRVRFFLRSVLSNVDVFLMQAQAHADRLVEMGAPRDRVRVTGNLKFDALEPPPAGEGLARLLRGRGPLVVAGSTLEGEEEMVLRAFKRVLKTHPGTRLLLAPRHPERFAQVPKLVEAQGFVPLRRTEAGESWPGDQVLVLDTLGELAQVYPFATLTFVGGSLVPWGGHNILEAAVAGKAVIVGPYMANFQEISDLFLENSALVQVPDEEALAVEMDGLLADGDRRERLGDRARALVRDNQGALQRTLEALGNLVA